MSLSGSGIAWTNSNPPPEDDPTGIVSPLSRSRHSSRRKATRYIPLNDIGDHEEGDISRQHSRNKHGLGIAIDKRGFGTRSSPLISGALTPGSGDTLIAPSSSWIPSAGPKDEGFAEPSNFKIDSHSPYLTCDFEDLELENSTVYHRDRSAETTDQITNSPALPKWKNCYFIILMVLATYSLVGSSIFLFIAVARPHYGRYITNSGGIPPETVSLLCALIAKTIELSFVTVFVAFLGQLLSRKAFDQRGGVSLAEMMMRGFIVQPGTLLTQFDNMRYALFTILGLLTILATFISLLYTTASEALVSPNLRFTQLEYKTFRGPVFSSFANIYDIGGRCTSPVSLETDPLYRNSTCLQIEHAGQAFHNFQQYLEKYTSEIHYGRTIPTDLSRRPSPVGIMNDNVTIEGEFIEIVNMTEVSIKHGRLVNNVTMAFPHAGIWHAARDPINEIMQPTDLNGLGQFNLTASVPSPVVNVLCVGMNETELSPLIYSEWSSNYTFDSNNWPPSSGPNVVDWYNATVVDSLFGFGKMPKQVPPFFPHLPDPYNTISNGTRPNYGDYAANSMHILMRSPPIEPYNTSAPHYVLCGLKAFQTPHCSTSFHATSSGGNLYTNCDSSGDVLEYIRSNPSAPQAKVEPDWKNLASEWANSLSLNAGITSGNASSARLLTQLVPTSTDTAFALSPSLPSIAEALAVLAGNTLLLSSERAPLSPFWNYNGTTVPEPVYEYFNASIRFQDFASGSTSKYQQSFFVVLGLTAVLSFVCWVYFVVVRLWLTDYTDPATIFAVAINSPQSETVKKPGDKELEEWHWRSRWGIGNHRKSLIFEARESETGESTGTDWQREGSKKLKRQERSPDEVYKKLREGNGRWKWI